MNCTVLYTVGMVFLATASLGSSEKTEKSCMGREFPVHDSTFSHHLVLRCSHIEEGQKVSTIMNYIQDKCYEKKSQIPTLFAAAIICGESPATIEMAWECPDETSSVQLGFNTLEKIHRALKAFVRHQQCFFKLIEAVLRQLGKKKIKCLAGDPIIDPDTGRDTNHYIYTLHAMVQHQRQEERFCDSFEYSLVYGLGSWAGMRQERIREIIYSRST